MSMETLKRDAEKKVSEGQEKVKTAQEMRAEIDALKVGLEGMPSGLDDEIASAIQAAEQAGRDQATSEVNEVENQANQDMAQAESIKGEVDAKISENNSAKAALESLKSNKFGGGIDSATSAIESNNAVGEDIKANVDAEFQAILNEIQAAGSGI